MHNQSDDYYSDPLILWLNSGETVDIDLRIAASTSAEFAQTYNVTVKGVSMNSSVTRELAFNLTVTSPPLTFTVINDNLTIQRGTEGDVFIQVNNSATTDANLTFDASQNLPPLVDVILYAVSPSEPGASRELNMTIMASGSNGFGINVSVRDVAALGEKTIPINIYYSGSFFETILVRVQVT
jgi:hypothetical protein